MTAELRMTGLDALAFDTHNTHGYQFVASATLSASDGLFGPKICILEKLCRSHPGNGNLVHPDSNPFIYSRERHNNFTIWTPERRAVRAAVVE